MKVECDNCGKEFERKPSQVGERNFCSQACFGKARRNRIVKTCQNCGKEFSIRKSHAERGEGKYCSRECLREAKGFECSVTKKCKYCGQEFKIPAAWDRKDEDHGQYCSRDCFAKARHKKGTESVECAFCGKEFREIKSRVENQHLHFCNKEHRDKFLKENYKAFAPKKFQYNGHQKPKSERAVGEAKSRIREKDWRKKAKRRRDIDSRTCQICGASDSYQVHHLIPWRWGKDNSISNLITLCRSCHRKLEAVTKNCEPNSVKEAKYLLLAVHLERLFQHLDNEAEKIKRAVRRT